MKHFLLVLFIACSFFCLQAQVQLQTEFINKENGYTLIAQNKEILPVSVEVSFEKNNLKNIKSSVKNKTIVVVPAQAINFEIAQFTIIEKNKAFGIKDIFTQYNFGDITLKPDLDFQYSLPFSQNKTFKIYQGYNGTISHHNENALDFSLDTGEEVRAARAGIVSEVVDSNHKTCAHKSCAKYNNYVRIYHDDGTFASYVHIKKNGAKVKKGDAVEANQLIALSGNVGWSSGPHLHFVVYQNSLTGQRKTVKTKFRINKGNQISYLEEGKSYTKSY